jgi:sulfur-oxidizing protein SoxY
MNRREACKSMIALGSSRWGSLTIGTISCLLPNVAKAQAIGVDLTASSEAIKQFAQGKTIVRKNVQLEVASLIDNGNTVPIQISVVSPMTTQDRVVSLLLLAPLNPVVKVFEANFGELCAKAEISTRIRLATTQTLIALVRNHDGQIWQGQAEALVTLAACIEPSDG